MRQVELLDHPSPRRRASKRHWRQVVLLVERALAQARAELDPEVLRLSLSSPVVGLSTRLDARPGLRVGSLDPGPVEASSQHVVVITHPEESAVTDRMALFRRGIRALRPAGRLVVVASVVPSSQTTEDEGAQVPSCSSLLEQLQTASGQGLHMEDLMAVRWGDEPMQRGAALSMTRISPPVGW